MIQSGWLIQWKNRFLYPLILLYSHKRNKCNKGFPDSLSLLQLPGPPLFHLLKVSACEPKVVHEFYTRSFVRRGVDGASTEVPAGRARLHRPVLGYVGWALLKCTAWKVVFIWQNCWFSWEHFTGWNNKMSGENSWRRCSKSNNVTVTFFHL